MSDRVSARQPPSVQSPWGSGLCLGGCVSARMGTCIFPHASSLTDRGKQKDVDLCGLQEPEPLLVASLELTGSIGAYHFQMQFKNTCKITRMERPRPLRARALPCVPRSVLIRVPGWLPLASVLSVLLFSSRSRLFSYYCALLKRKCRCLFWSF